LNAVSLSILSRRGPHLFVALLSHYDRSHWSVLFFSSSFFFWLVFVLSSAFLRLLSPYDLCILLSNLADHFLDSAFRALILSDASLASIMLRLIAF